jgi:hypothetical protein
MQCCVSNSRVKPELSWRAPIKRSADSDRFRVVTFEFQISLLSSEVTACCIWTQP